MYRKFMHAWERRCHDKDNNRVVRPFEWGLEFLSPNPVIHHGEANGAAQAVAPLNQIEQFNERVIPNSHEFYLPAPARPEDFDFDGFMLRFPSSITTISETNNTVYARFYPAQKNGKESERAVIVMPQWNGDVNAHVAICQALNKFGISALRLSLPYHDWRKPPELERADYMVSANLGRTIQSVQQAVHDIRRSADWLQLHGIRRIGVMGTSVGSCVGFLAQIHDERLAVGVFNHVSCYFGDVVWQGITTHHIRQSLAKNLTLEEARKAWLSISPSAYIPKLQGLKRKVKMIAGRYDLTFPFDLTQIVFDDCERHNVAFEKVILPCGHYTSGKAPFKFLDGYHIISYFVKELK